MEHEMVNCPECGGLTVVLYWSADASEPRRAEYFCACLSILAEGDEFGPPKPYASDGMVEDVAPSDRVLAYVEEVKQAGKRVIAARNS